MSNVSNPMITFIEKLAVSESEDEEEESDEGVDEESEDVENEEETTTMDSMPRAKRDLTAAQFYSGIKETLS